MTGIVKFFNEDKGFGFITSDETGKDVFVHITGLKEVISLEGGEKVDYEEEDGRKGIVAVNVTNI